MNVFDVFVHAPFFTELFLTELALEGLESPVYGVDVSLEVSCLSKLLTTLLALVGLELLMNLSDVAVKIIFYCEHLATAWTSAVIDICVDCALVF